MIKRATNLQRQRERYKDKINIQRYGDVKMQRYNQDRLETLRRCPRQKSLSGAIAWQNSTETLITFSRPMVRHPILTECFLRNPGSLYNHAQNGHPNVSRRTTKFLMKNTINKVCSDQNKNLDIKLIIEKVKLNQLKLKQKVRVIKLKLQNERKK